MTTKLKLAAWNTAYFLTTGAGALSVITLLVIVMWLGAMDCTSAE